MQIFLRILKETGIALVVLVLVALTIWFLFQEQLPFLTKNIPSPVNYVKISPEEFDIKGDIESETNPTQTYEATNEHLSGYIADRIVSTGLPNPFNSNNAEADVPTEKVTITNPTIIGGDEAKETESAKTGSGVKSLE